MPYPISQATTVQPERRSQKRIMLIAHASDWAARAGIGSHTAFSRSSHGSSKIAYPTLPFLASNFIITLNSANQLITLSFDDLPIVVGQLSPLLLALVDELLPSSCDLVGVHFGTFAHEVNRTVGTNRKASEFRLTVCCTFTVPGAPAG